MGDIISIDNALIWLQKNAKTTRGLIVILILLSSSYYCFFGILDHYMSKALIANLFVSMLFFIYFAWWYYRNQSKLAIGKELKIAIAFQTDEIDSIDKINKILSPCINKLKRNSNLRFISFVELPANELISEQSARIFIEKNHFGIERLIWLKIEIGYIDDIESLVIRDLKFCHKSISNRIFFQGIEINMQNEMEFILSNSDMKLIRLNQLLHKENLKEQVRQIILYFLGVSCVFEMKFAESLQILKEIYIPKNSVLFSIHDMEQKRILYEVSRENLLSARLRDLLSKIYTQVVWQYQKMDRVNEAYRICIEAKDMLGEIEPAYWIYVQLARLSYEIGRIKDAKIYTMKMRNIAGKETDEVVVNEAFFAILDDNIEQVINCYGKLSSTGITSGVIDIITFLNEYKPEFVSQSFLRDYGVGILTYYYVDEVEGKRLLQNLKKNTANRKKFKPMTVHINQLIKPIIKKKES